MAKYALRLAEHLRKYLLLYVVLAIVAALPIGYYAAPVFKASKELMKNLIISLAITTLYPSMVQLRSEKFGGELRERVRDTAVGLTFIFVVAPLLAIVMASFIQYKQVAIGFVAANSVPASSASIAYVLLAEGNLEFATLLAIISILGALVSVPLWVGLYANTLSIHLPLTLLGESVGLALITPYVLGQATRYYLVKVGAKKVIKTPTISLPCKNIMPVDLEKEPLKLEEFLRKVEDVLECIEGRISKKIKPYLSLATMLSMLALISLLIANKAYLLIAKPDLAAIIIGSQLVIYSILIASLIAVSKVMKQSYEDHMAMAFITITKNESVAAAVSVMAISTAATIPAALIPAIQPVISIAYLSIIPLLKRMLKSED